MGVSAIIAGTIITQAFLNQKTQKSPATLDPKMDAPE
jgi:hypothetical protein